VKAERQPHSLVNARSIGRQMLIEWSYVISNLSLSTKKRGKEGGGLYIQIKSNSVIAAFFTHKENRSRNGAQGS
jgi:hypothetical protein